jgi:hypothetical protein
MDEQFRSQFFDAVNQASISPNDESTKIAAGDISVDLTAKQVALAQQYEKKCLATFLKCMRDTTGDMQQEAW